MKTIVDWTYPSTVRRYEELITILEELGSGDEALRIKASGLLRALHNYRTNRQGMLEGLVDGGILAQKKREQQALAELRRAVDTGVRRNWRGVFFFDPILEPLRDEPEFAEIVAILEADMAVQLRNVRAMEAAGDLVRFPD